MKIPGLIEITDEHIYSDLEEYKKIQIDFTRPDVAKVLTELDIIHEMKFWRLMIYELLAESNIQKDEKIALTFDSPDELIFNLGILMSIQSEKIKYDGGEMIYTGHLRNVQYNIDMDFGDDDYDYELED